MGMSLWNGTYISQGRQLSTFEVTNIMDYITIHNAPMKRKKMDTPWIVSSQPILTPDGNIFPVGTIYKAFETKNFGYLVLGPQSKTIDGRIPNRRIFNY